MQILILLPILVTLAGAYMIVKTKGFFLLHPIKTVRHGICALRKKNVFSALTLALAGTLGVGNIFGVAMGIILGGAGSVFWLVLSAVFSCSLKYSEVLMTHSYTEKEASHGMPDVIKSVFPGAGVFLSALYSALCLCLAFVMGASVQARSISGVIEGTLGTSRVLIAPLLVICVISLTSCGTEKIESFTKKTIPLSSIIYISMTFCVIIVNFPRIPTAIFEIISSAFSLKSAASGVFSYGFLAALREGYARGVMSNEAGIGTSSFAHGRAKTVTPHEGGLLGIFEVLFDTVFICGITGLAMITAIPEPDIYDSGMSLVLAAFSSIGAFAAPMLVFCVVCFAFSSIVCWYYYGEECKNLLFGKRGGIIYTSVFMTAVVLGVFLSDGFSVRLTDALLLFMSIPILMTIIKSSDRISALSELEKYRYLIKHKKIARRANIKKHKGAVFDAENSLKSGKESKQTNSGKNSSSAR